MLIKLFLAAVLSLSVSCYAESGSDQPKKLLDSSQIKKSSTDTGSSTQSAPPSASAKKAESQSSQDTNQDEKPSMIKYCQEHTC